MNEFIEQFILESRELVEQATDDLLALEEQPADAARLDGAFRAFHTLKGGAGIVDFAAMGRALHVAEDVLSAVRSGAAQVTPTLISDCLTCLDQVVQWLDAMEVTGEPPGDADVAADAVIARFGKSGDAPPTALPDTPDQWLDAFIAKHTARLGDATLAIRYRPDADCFFRGEDPLALMAEVPGLLALDLSPEGPWPPLDAFDPFTCQLILTALSGAPADEVEATFRRVRNQVEITPLQTQAAASGQAGLGAAPTAILDEQLLLLADLSPDGLQGRAASAGRTAANVLRSAGRPGQAVEIEHLAQGQGAATSQALAAAIQRALASSADTTEGAAPAARAPQEATRSLRVDVERVDALVDLAGELTVVKNALGHAAALALEAADPKALATLLKDQHALLDRLVADLQRSVLSIRVLPLRHVFQRFPRLVREIAASLGKPARLVVEGDETEADKVVVEALFEPLLHVLRNALDHGVEPAQARARAGKPEIATVQLRAGRRGEHVVVELEDDGAGVDVARVRQVAAQRGVADALAAMDDGAVIDLIFAPGFSTAAEVTGLSGRGVGMDAVRTAIERLGGRVEVESRPGLGTTVRFILPFTVMITRVMTVEAGGQPFGVPLEAVVETVRIPRDRIAPVGAARAFVLRDRTIPLVDLAEALGQRGDGEAHTPEAKTADANVLIVTVAGALGGLEVDRFGERMDVMLKPMEGLLAGMPSVAGTTLLGDGRVLIVLDLQELLQ